MRRLLVVAVSAALLGCAFERLENGLNELLGTNINTLVYKWGHPNSKREIMGKTVYVWTNASTSSYVVPQTKITTDYVGTKPIYGDTISYTSQTINARCVIEIIVDDNEIIENWVFSGKPARCWNYATRLRP